jgi:raffinose/stachyose/melibiose transport system substrate-binding protein
MKKFLALATVLSMTLLSACGGGGGGKATDTPAKAATGDKKVLNFWYIDPGEKEKVYLEAVKRFEQKHPDVEVKALHIPNDAYKQKMQVSMAGGNGPDVFYSWGGTWLKQFADAGQALDITGKIDANQYLKLPLANATFNGKVYGVPMNIGATAFFYNKEIFQKLNLQPPKTYDDLLNVVDTLKKNNIIPISLANQTKWPGAYFMMYFADRLEGPELFQSAFHRQGRGFDDPGYVKAGQYIQDLVKRGAFNEGFNGIPYDAGQSRQLLYTGKAAMILMSNSFVNNAKQESPDFVSKMGMFKFPSMPGGKGDPSDLSGVSNAWSANAKTENPDLAVDLLKELTSTETGKAFADRTGSISATVGVESTDPFMKEMGQWVKDAKDIHWPYDQTLPSDLAELHKDTTQALFGLTMTPEEAAKKMEDKAKEVLKK